MRLIDKEKFNERLDFLLYELNFYANKDMTGFNDERTRTIGTFFITHIHNMLNRTSEVDAIPIEWLLKERDKNKEIAETLSKVDLNIDFIAKYGYTRSFHKVLMIEELLLDWRNWEKENGNIQDK